jgi:hypothetical protein
MLWIFGMKTQDNTIQYCLLFLGPCFVSSFKCLKFGSSFQIFKKYEKTSFKLVMVLLVYLAMLLWAEKWAPCIVKLLFSFMRNIRGTLAKPEVVKHLIADSIS